MTESNKLEIPGVHWQFAPQIPPTVGFWRLDNDETHAGAFQIAMRKKPTDQQIKNTEEAFGWKWIDA